jgi:vancomycin resistance protein YoaR
MKKALIALAIVVIAPGSAISILAARYQEVVSPNVSVGPVVLGGLTPEEARYKLRVWWEAEKIKPFEFGHAQLTGAFPAMKANDLGLTLDDEASIDQLPRQGFVDALSVRVGRVPTASQVFQPVFKANGLVPVKFQEAIVKTFGENVPARAFYREGRIEHKPEVPTMSADPSALPDALSEALMGDRKVILPLVAAPKQVQDEELVRINAVIAEFHTTFSASNRPRSANIKLASDAVDGIVLAPGGTFSFNSSVGPRTSKAGYQLAGVFTNGRHDTGIGGGICQVSTTIYNAALFANLGIKKRLNHSLPVPYVPVGRDAVVSWGGPDLVLENTSAWPVAIASEYKPGRLTVRVLGQEQPGLSVKVEQGEKRSWSHDQKRVPDAKLPEGKTRVVEPGANGYSVSTYRLVYQDGQLLRREPLGRSNYAGGPKIIAYGTAKPAPIPATSVPPPPPDDLPPFEDFDR